MSSPLPRYKRIKKVNDPRFDVDHIDQYVLSIYLGTRDCQIGVLDSSNSQLVYIEDYAFSKLCSSEEQLLLLQHLCESHPFLNAGFWQSVNFVIKNKKFTHIPTALFAEKEALSYLNLSAQVENQEKVLHCRHKTCDIVTVFAIHNSLLNWAKNKYKNSTVHFFHQATPLIEGIHTASQHQKGTPMYIYMDRFKLHITLIHRGRLVYYNCFPIKEFSDYVKYIILVFRTMKMNVETSRVILWGYIGRKSPHLRGLSKYIKNISLGKRPHHLKFSHVFDEIENHNFFDLYSISLLTP